MNKKRTKMYWLLLLTLLFTASAVMSVGTAQARYINTATWETVLDVSEDLVSSNLLQNNANPPLTILLGEMSQETYQVPITLQSGADVEGELTWSVSPENYEEYLSVEMSLDDAVMTMAEDDEEVRSVGLLAGKPVEVMMRLIPHENTFVEIREEIPVTINVKWGNTLTGTFLVLLPEVKEPEATEPEVTEPEVTEPEVTEPEVTEPEVTEPEVTEPEVTEPEVTEPEVTEPEVTEPEVTEPEVTEPEVTEPEVTEPKVTEPEVTEPEATASEKLELETTEDNKTDVEQLEPEVTEPEVTEPEVTEPEVTEPEVTEPEVTDLEVTEPEVTEPEVTEPEVTDLEVTEPEVTEPVVTEPKVTDLEVTEPEVTEPVVTEPEVTEPEVTEPEVTEPEVTEPEVTEPEVTEPEVTEPEVTEPEVTEPELLEISMETKESFALSEQLPLEITAPKGVVSMCLGMGIVNVAAEGSGENAEMVISHFPRFLCYSLDHGASYYMLYHPGTIELKTGKELTVPVLLDFSRTDLDGTELVLAVSGHDDESLVGAGFRVITVAPSQQVTMSTRFLTKDGTIKISLPKSWKEYTMEYTIEILAENQQKEIVYMPVDMQSEKIKTKRSQSGGILTIELGEILPQAGTYRITMEWIEDGECVRQAQEIFFINYMSHIDTVETGGAVQ